MTDNKLSVDLTREQIGVIEAALRTQEKILSVQSRADADGTVRARLAQLQQVLRTLDLQSGIPPRSECQGWGSMARGIFG